MPEKHEPISEPYPSDFVPAEEGGAHVGSSDSAQPADEFKQEMLKKFRLTPSEHGAEARTASVEAAERWLGKMIDDKQTLVIDAERQSDAEAARDFKKESEDLQQLLRDIQNDNWKSINISDPEASPLLTCISETQASFDYQNAHGPKERADKTARKLRALEAIRKMVEQNQRK
ncbi:MAG: hypothetical protein PHW53_03060 [Patescibacteria group bacterium]|nr:hypothetical protein [Patescibacteria group bacterium]